MSEHPGIVFRPGPTRRQAALASGPDVREVAHAVKSARSTEPELADDRLPGLIADAAAALRMPAVRGVQNGDPCTLLARFWETVQGCEAAGAVRCGGRGFWSGGFEDGLEVAEVLAGGAFHGDGHEGCGEFGEAGWFPAVAQRHPG